MAKSVTFFTIVDFATIKIKNNKKYAPLLARDDVFHERLSWLKGNDFTRGDQKLKESS